MDSQSVSRGSLSKREVYQVEGTVSENTIYGDDDNEAGGYKNVTDYKNGSLDLQDILEDLKGKRVRVTVEPIE